MNVVIYSWISMGLLVDCLVFGFVVAWIMLIVAFCFALGFRCRCKGWWCLFLLFRDICICAETLLDVVPLLI